ncbi:MAG: hypothetical protein SVX43_00445 [Cyanobacteriota bacterium]|nr:hypothetical protein [Cyanobacteriota bacterium]
MAQRMDETIQQARQGSITALIQLMNERLEDSGIRTRAMFAEGILQILCEASTVEQLEKARSIGRLKAILEELALPNFRRIRVNARIAREQQLLWLDEINRDPDSQLLWSEELKLTPPNVLQQLGRAVRQQKQQLVLGFRAKPNPLLVSARSHRPSHWKGVIGGIALGLSLAGGLWVGTRWHARQAEANQEVQAPRPASEVSRSAQSDPFAEAIRLAESSALKGQTATTAAEWLDLAAKWQRASELMQSIPKSDPRYATARERATLYRKNSEMAQTQARRAQ